MPFRTTSLVAMSLALILAIVAAVFIRQLDESLLRQNQITRSRYEDYVLSSGLRQSSDDLTRMVRLFAVTGDPRYRQYFDDILAIRNGEAPRPEQYFELPWWDFVLAAVEPPGSIGRPLALQSLLQQASFADDELALLEEAESQSNELGRLESELIAIVASQLEGANGEYRLEGAALAAMQRLHDQEYHLAKERVMRPLASLSEVVSSNFFDRRSELYGTILDTIWYVLLVTGTAALLGIFVLVTDRKRSVTTGNQPGILTVLVILSLLSSIVWLLQIHGDHFYVYDHLNRRFDTYLLSNGLRQTSDDLTRMVRLYAVTGEDRYRQYFQQILDIRNGVAPRPLPYFEIPYWDTLLASGNYEGRYGDAVSFRILAGEAGFTEMEFGFLDASEALSNELVALENEVMETVIQGQEAGQGDYRLENGTLAAALRLHGQEYHLAKLKVMQPLAELLRTVEESFEKENAHSQERIEQFNVALTISVLLSLLFGALALRAWWRA